MDTLGLIGDVHAEDAFLAAALEHLAVRGVSQTCCTGDIPDGPGSVDRCVDLLRARGVVTVAGNHERWLLAQRLRDLPHATPISDLAADSIAFLESLPATVELTTPLGNALLCHGMGPNDMSSVKPHDFGYALETNDELQALLAPPRRFQLILNGHTHERMVRTIDGLTIVNAGTLCSEETPGFAVVDFTNERVELFDIDPTLAVIPSDVLPLRHT